MNFGVQLFTIPKLVDEDFEATIQLLSEIGYKEIEFFGPYPFSAPKTIEEWGAIKQMLGLKRDAFYGYDVSEVKTILDENGISAPSFHTDLNTLRTKLTETLDSVSIFEPKYLVIPSIDEGRASLDDYKRLTEEFNSLGEKMNSYNVKFVYHNHGYEHKGMDGVEPMHFLIQNTDPQFVQFELDIFWMNAAGADPIAFLKMYPDRFRMLHLKDSSEQFRFSGDGGSPDQWIPAFGKMRDPGDGVFDISELLKQGKAAGVEHYFLERDLAPDAMGTLKNSIQNLKVLSRGG